MGDGAVDKNDMKSAATTLTAPPPTAWRERLAIVAELSKARLTVLVLLTTWVGFYVGSAGGVDLWRMFHTVAGTALLACGAAILNQYSERDFDAKMRRTAARPLPSGRIDPDAALALGATASVCGMIWLLAKVSPLTALLGGASLASYLFVYTPLKRLTPLNTLVGAVPGALPPLLGWAAASGRVDAGGWALFAILFFWQLPHFFAIAWLYREDYVNGGFRMLSAGDHDGQRTAAAALRNTLALAAISLLPFLHGSVGRAYVTGALLLGAGFVAFAGRFAQQRTPNAARRLFFASILYLPLLLGLLVADKPNGRLSRTAATSALASTAPAGILRNN